MQQQCKLLISNSHDDKIDCQINVKDEIKIRIDCCFMQFVDHCKKILLIKIYFILQTCNMAINAVYAYLIMLN